MLKHRIFLLFVTTFMVLGCDQTDSQNKTKAAEAETAQASELNVKQDRLDPHSFSNPESIVINHLELDLTVDFDTRVLHGTAKIDLERKNDKSSILVLDTNALTIKHVTSNGQPLEFNLGTTDPLLGTPLTIKLANDSDSITINYATSPSATGVQWLTPEQTSSGEHPFLFTQAQATHARSFIPIQDSPQVRLTYSATIRTPKALRAVMSAANDPNAERDGVYEFTMPQPIPAYLIALGVGDLEFKAMGDRTGVYAEPQVLAAAAKEFEDTEAMLEVTEQRYGAYQWERYDLLILPPSFPFGGMENPRLSFITPTVIAGDKSLVSLIAHELAHSWSGNSTSNATWRDLWLNEGFTTYLTYRIMEMIYGTDRYNMEAVLGYQDLIADIEELNENDQLLAIDLSGRDPDLVFSNVPYEKGALFLRELEHRIGRDNFDQFLLDYFSEFAFQSITTGQFVDYLDKTLLADYQDKLDATRIHEWIYKPGIPAGAPVPISDAFSDIDAQRTAWLNNTLAAENINTNNWTVHEWLYFLNNLPAKLNTKQLTELDKSFNLTASPNNEIAHSWLLISVNNWYEPALPRLYEYLTSIGRNKLVKPLYRALSQTEQGKELGKRAFEEAKSGYHPLTVKANQAFFQDN